MTIAANLGLLTVCLSFTALFGYAVFSQLFGAGKVERERKRSLDAQRGSRARAKGWRYDDASDGDIRYRLYGSGPGGIAWKIEYDSDFSSSTSNPKLIFRADMRRGGIEWQIMDRWAFGVMQNGIARMIGHAVVAMLSRLSEGMEEHRAFMARAAEIPAGTRTFRERFVLFGIDRAAAALIDGESERLILKWPDFKPSFSRRDNCFSASLGPRGLEVRIACDGPSFEVIEHLARLGQHLAERIDRR